VLVYVAIALIVGAALAVATALASSGTASPTSAGRDAGTPSAGALLSEDEAADDLVAADPARERPPLDKFKPKDPFKPFPRIDTGGGTSDNTNGGNPVTPDPGASSPSEPTTLNYRAVIKVDGKNRTVNKGDQVPPGSAAVFEVANITSGDVEFRVIKGALESGDTSFSVSQGNKTEVRLDSGKVHTIAVISIVSIDSGSSSSSGSGSGSGSSSSAAGGSSASFSKGHSISILSINGQGATAVVTFKVDGKTYADKKQGDVINTSWGQIEVVSINVKAQTVTLRHGDQTLTLRAGQVVVK